MIKYSTISLPRKLYNELQKLIKENPQLGYGSVADFCKEAIRMRVKEIKRGLRENVIDKYDVASLFKNLENLSAIDAGIYGKAFEKMDLMVFIFTKDFKIKECNNEFYSHLGYTGKEEIIGCDIYRFFDGRFKDKLRRRNELNDYETKAIRKDGKRIDILLSIKNLDGKRYVGIAKDVTIKNYLIEKGKKIRRIYEYLIDEISDCVAVIQNETKKFLNK